MMSPTCMHHAACTCSSMCFGVSRWSWSGATSGNSVANDQADNEIHWAGVQIIIIFIVFNISGV